MTVMLIELVRDDAAGAKDTAGHKGEDGDKDTRMTAMLPVICSAAVTVWWILYLT